MKKIAAVILLVPLFLNTAGYHLYFTIRRIALRAEMHKFLLVPGNNEYTQVLHFNMETDGSIQGLEWEGDDEFRLKGEMYDVVEKTVEGNQVTLRCISDTKETTLFADYEGASRNDFGNPSAGHKYAHWLKLATALFTIPMNTAYPSGINRLPDFQCKRWGVYHAAQADIPTPPPWFLS